MDRYTHMEISNELQNIPLEDMIAGPMQGAIKASAAAAQSTIEFIEKVGFEGKNRTIIRNHIFIIFFFPGDPKYIIKFLTFLRKDRRVYVESIGFDNLTFKLLYASRTYLNKMDKYKAKEYLSNRNSIEDEDFKKVILAV